MAYFTAREDKPADYCRQQLRQADVYVGIIGFRYGSPVADDPDQSYTELELDTATDLGLPRLLFMLDNKAELPLPQSFLSDPAYGERQSRFRARIKEIGMTVAAVASPDRLELLLFQALIELRGQAAGAAELARSAYAEQVQRIAPVELKGRDGELAELAAFCTQPGHGAYVWWQAPAWAGKSALMSWFVLHPPPGMPVVSFFITGRYKGQDDRAAFIDAVTGQLAVLLGEPVPGYLAEAAREQYLLRQLAQAAGTSRGLVLVVDGLDEDRGVTEVPDSYSIAALLPTRPPAGLRIIVAGRPDPPVPDDVPDDHPLRDPGIVRVLDPSSTARVVRSDMQRELKQLLHGSEGQQDLLGLVTAAGGGLSARDLAELTGTWVKDVEETLQTVAGRSFASRTEARQSGTALPVYVLGHEELQAAAVARLGPTRLERYRERLHHWAQDYRSQGWPDGTPPYLLRGYFRLLLDASDVPRLVKYACDRARHDLMLGITGGDAVALAEIIDVQDLMLRLKIYDLPVFARLNAHRGFIADRNARIPPGLPAVWAAVGHLDRAEALARSIPDLQSQARALADVATVAASTDDLARAAVLAGQAETLARSIPDQNVQAKVLADLVTASVGANDLDRARVLVEQAEMVARSITNPVWRAAALEDVAAAVVNSGDLDRAEALARSIPDQYHRARALADVAKAVAVAGEPDRARVLARQAGALAKALTRPDLQVTALGYLAAEAAGAGDLDQARTLAGHAEALVQLITPLWQAGVLAYLAVAAVRTDDMDRARTLTGRAETLARSTPSLGWSSEALACLARVLIDAGYLDRAESLAQSIIDPGPRARTLTCIAKVVSTRDLDRAEALVRSITDPDLQAKSLADLAAVVAAAGDRDRARVLVGQAEVVARSVTNPGWQTMILADLAAMVAVAGSRDRARVLVGQAEAMARSITNSAWQAEASSDLARAAARAGDLDRAETLVQSITEPNRQDSVLPNLATAAVLAGDVDRAEVLARSVTDLDMRALALANVARAAAGEGELDRAGVLAGQAEALVRSIAASPVHADALADVAAAVAGVGDLDRAESLARSIPEPDWQARALADVAAATAGAGDRDRARMLAERAEALVQSITDSRSQVHLLADLARAAASWGDLDRAKVLAGQSEALARSIPDPVNQAGALAGVAAAVAGAGDLDRAESLARSIPDPDWQARALAGVAREAAPDQARYLLALALSTANWHSLVEDLGRADPDAVIAIADEYLSPGP
jgi:hypothetical protein